MSFSQKTRKTILLFLRSWRQRISLVCPQLADNVAIIKFLLYRECASSNDLVLILSTSGGMAILSGTVEHLAGTFIFCVETVKSRVHFGQGDNFAPVRYVLGD